MSREDVINAFTQTLRDGQESNQYQLDNLDYARIVKEDGAVQVENEHGSRFDLDELTDEELNMFAQDLNISLVTDKEARVYVVNVDEMETGDRPYHELTDEEFIEQSEKQGTVYTLQGFATAFNEEEISSSTQVIRILFVHI